MRTDFSQAEHQSCWSVLYEPYYSVTLVYIHIIKHTHTHVLYGIVLTRPWLLRR